MNNKVRTASIAILSVLALGSCGKQVAQEFPHEDVLLTSSILDSASGIPIAASELVAIQAQLLNKTLKLNALSSTFTTSFDAPDILGNPFIRVVITSKEPIKDIWKYAASLNEQNNPRLDYAFAGASTAREPVMRFGNGAELLIKLYATRKNVGEENIKRYVAIDSNNLLLQLKDGTYLDALSGVKLSNDSVVAIIENYRSMESRNSTVGYKEKTSKRWIAPLATFERINKLAGLARQSIRNEDHLNVSDFGKYLTEKSEGLKPQNMGYFSYTNCYHTSMSSDDDVCEGTRSGEILGNTDYNGGYEQSITRIPARAANFYKVGNGKSTEIGCVNASIISMLAWLNKLGLTRNSGMDF